MALIKCPECEHMISSQADNCPECGMSLRYIACPICGSKRLYSATEGYSGLKGAAGFLTFGAVGLLVGTHGSKDVRITCKDCGNHFPLSKVKKVDMTLSSTSESNTKYKQLINDKKLLDAIKLYKAEWDTYGFGLLDNTNVIKLVHDFSIHSGPSIAIKNLQQILNKKGHNLTTDGYIGEKTNNAINCVDEKW